MPLHLGPVPDNFEPDAAWRELKKPGPIAIQLLALPVGLVAAATATCFWLLVGLDPRYIGQGLRLVALMAFLVHAIPPLILAHELSHAIAYPSFTRTILGFWPRGMLAYAVFPVPLSRNRCLFAGAMPILVLSVLPWVAAATGVFPQGVMWAAAGISIVHSLLNGVDILLLGQILLEVPPEAVVHHKGWSRFWRAGTWASRDSSDWSRPR